MPTRNQDLHGSAPDESRVALLLIDVVNDMDFAQGARLLEEALPMAERLVLTGMATEVCVLFTANDAYLRDYHLFVPSDCVASEDPGERERALHTMAALLKADTRPSGQLDLDAMRARG